ncbi:hypothetical protein J8J14_22565 [Roseomonas sp. SSH11]|uniref:Uncharacterized protein n=1 Tax=Pararoseomonas baculiformis TaxID=2820812 RepID=A0ABS4AKJ7_9PROT|nr:hypothetical protein [Pararoseomonas baculiformis]MBP0447546.1 hypothetical protein [Pararoseomonas baculiformis]
MRPGRQGGLAATAAVVVGEDTTALVTIAREQQERGQRDLYLVGASLRHRLAPGLSLGVLGTVGIGQDSPQFRVPVAMEYQFSLGGR